MSAAIVDTSPIPHRYFTDTPPILHRYFIITSPSISVDISVATRSIPRSVLCRYDILPTHRSIPNEYRSMPRSILCWQRTTIITTKYARTLFVLGSELFSESKAQEKLWGYYPLNIFTQGCIWETFYSGAARNVGLFKMFSSIHFNNFPGTRN